MSKAKNRNWLENMPSRYFVIRLINIFVLHKLGLCLGLLVKADDSDPRGPGFDSCERITFSVYSMDGMIYAPLTCLTLNRLLKSNGRT